MKFQTWLQRGRKRRGKGRVTSATPLAKYRSAMTVGKCPKTVGLHIILTIFIMSLSNEMTTIIFD